jgi:sugar/nucleoside kinase (ribokinase family)
MNKQQIKVIGDASVDFVLGPVEGWPRKGTETLVRHSEMRPGGSAGNAALALAELGWPVALYSACGSDDMGQWLCAHFGAGVELHLPRIAGPTTSTVAILHACGERSFFTTPGHLELIARDTVAAAVPHQLPGHANAGAAHAGQLALLCGPFLTPPLRAAYGEFIAQLRASGHQVALDTGWPSGGWTEPVRAQALDWIRACDHVLLNEIEVSGLAGGDTSEAALAQLASAMRPGATLVMKMGPGGACAIRDGVRVQARAPVAEVFDTVGAGDAFNAGYLAAISRGDDLSAALAFGCATATAIIARFPRRASGDPAPGSFPNSPQHSQEVHRDAA